MLLLPDLATQPCERAKALREIRDERAIDGQVTQSRHRTYDSEREARFDKVDPAAFDRLIREADAACAALTGAPNPTGRRVMRGGSFGGCLPYRT